MESTRQSDFVSWYRDVKGDDLGRPVVQHKPLNKGPYAQAGLPKSFADVDPGMTCRVMAPSTVNKAQTALTNDDIAGSKPRPKDIPKNPRNTNPVSPIYQLPGSSTTTLSNVQDSITETNDAAVTASSVRKQLRNLNDVTDIDGARPMPMPQFRPKKQDLCLDITDIQGSNACWQSGTRSLRNGLPTDKRFDVSDITMPKRQRPFSARVGHTGVEGHTHNRQRPASALACHSPHTAAASCVQPTGVPQVEYTGLPYFQQPSPVPKNEHEQCQRPDPRNVVFDQLATTQQQQLDRINEQAARAKRQQQLLNPRVAQDIRAKLAKQADEAKEGATQVIRVLQVNRSEVGRLWDALRASDREGSGKVTVKEFCQAIQTAGMSISQQQLLTLANGLRDGVGLLAYKELTTTLLQRTKQRPSYNTTSTCLARPQSALGLRTSENTTIGLTTRQTNTCTHASNPVQQQRAQTPPAVATGNVLLTDMHSQNISMAERQVHSHHPHHHHNHHHHSTQQQPDMDQWIVTAQQCQHVEPPPGAEQQHEPASVQQSCAHEHQQCSEAGAGSALIATGLPSRQDVSSSQLPSNVVLLGPEGAKYYTYKGKTYWFSGNDSTQALTDAAAGYQARHDLTHSLDLRYKAKGLGSGEALTTDTFLNDGVVSKEVGTAAHKRPTSGKLLPSQNPGHSIASNMLAVVGGLQGTGKSIEPMIKAAIAGQTRVATARPSSAAAGTTASDRFKPLVSSFTSIANAGAGGLMQRHDKALLQEEIACVRMLG